MEATTSSEFPDAFDGVEFGAVGRDEVQAKASGADPAPGFVKSGVVVAGVVRDDDGAPVASACDRPELAEKGVTGGGVERALLAPEHEATVADSDGPEVLDALACRMVKEHGVPYLGGNPHATAGAVLLEVDLVHGPQVNGGVSGQGAEFFCAPVEARGRREPLGVGACEAGSPNGGTAAGTGAGRVGRPSSRR
jgi:hypothetical protein